MSVITEARIGALEDVATHLRIGAIRATSAAGSGHPSSCASAADLVAAIFFSAMHYNPADPRAPENDRFVLSKGHAAPILYAAWAEAGLLSTDDLVTLRRIDSDLEGHPTPRLPFVDVATGSLGQGLSVGVGLALGARLEGRDSRVFVLLGDGEVAEGAIWEAAQMAGHERLDALVAVVDVNRMGQSGPTMLGHDVNAHTRRFRAFGWRAIEVDGHDMRQIVPAFARARRRAGSPTVIVARTIKGQGIDEIADREGWHGRALPADAAERVIAALTAKLHGAPRPPIELPRPRPRSAPEPAPPAATHVPPLPSLGASVATREAYGDALVRLGASDPRVVVLDGDVKNSTFAERFAAAYPGRYIEGYIAEQNMVSVAAGLAARGHVPFASTFACFLTRAADQVRMAGISRSNVKLCGSHAGVSIGEDGPSQMALEDLALFRAIPEAVVLYPSDAIAADAAVRLAAAHTGIVYIRTTRPKAPVLYAHDEPFRIGDLKVVRQSAEDRATVVGAGVTLQEALAAHDALAADGIRVRVIDLFSVKPVDAEALRAAARETGNRLVTVEDHYAEGGLADAVRAAVAELGVRVVSLAVREIPRSGPPAVLLDRYGISRAAIVRTVKALLESGR